MPADKQGRGRRQDPVALLRSPSFCRSHPHL